MCSAVCFLRRDNALVHRLEIPREEIFMAFNSGVCGGRASQSSRNKRTWHFSLVNHLSSSRIYFSKKFFVIHTLVFASNFVKELLKHLGFLDLPITRTGHFSEPSQFAPTKTEILDLEYFPLVHIHPLKCRLLKVCIT